MKINLILNKAIIYALLFAMSHVQVACSGCSPSGRRSQQKNISIYKTNPTPQDKNITRSTAIRSNRINSKPILPLNELYNQYKNSVFLVFTSDGKKNYQGTGFFISKSGLAVSNYHVFEGTSMGWERIETSNGQKFKISEVLEKSKEHDYIIFRVKIDNYKIQNPIPVVAQSPEVGEDVFAIGNPRGLNSTLSKGIVSALRQNNSLIQTTTEITHGSSGGPLLNMKGEVLGITTAGMGEANLNFAINIEMLKLYRFQLYE